MEGTGGLLGILGEADIVRAAIATRTNSQLHQTVCDHIKDHIVDSKEKQKTKKKIDVRRNLDQEQIQLLNELYPERHIVTSSYERGTHNFAAASRIIELDILLSKFPKDKFVYDIGGNWASHVKRNDNRRVHCCCPILDFRDAQRKSVRWASIEKFVAEKESIPEDLGNKIKQLYSDESRIRENVRKQDLRAEAMDGVWYCQNKFEDCVHNVANAAAIAIHSIYDIEIEDLVDALEEKQIKQLTGTFLFSVELLMGSKRGELPTVNGFFEVEGDKVKYGFYDDPNCGYTHNLQQLKKYLTKTYVKARGGSVYYLELNDIRGDVVFFTFTDATEAVMMGVSVDESFKCIPVNAANKVVFPLFSLNERSKELEFSEVILPRDFVSRAVEYVDRVKDNQNTVDNIRSYLFSTNNSVVIAGASRKTVEKVNPLLISRICTTLQVYSEVRREKEKRVMIALKDQVREDVSLNSLFAATVARVFGKVSVWQRALRAYATWIGHVYGCDVLNFANMPLYVEIHDRIRLWSQTAQLDGFFHDMADLEEKMRVHREIEEERKRISECIASEKLGDLYVEVDVCDNVSERNVEARVLRPMEHKKGAINLSIVNSWCEEGSLFALDERPRKVHTPLKNLLGKMVEIIFPKCELSAVMFDEQGQRVYADSLDKRQLKLLLDGKISPKDVTVGVQQSIQSEMVAQHDFTLDKVVREVAAEAFDIWGRELEGVSEEKEEVAVVSKSCRSVAVQTNDDDDLPPPTATSPSPSISSIEDNYPQTPDFTTPSSPDSVVTESSSDGEEPAVKQWGSTCSESDDAYLSVSVMMTDEVKVSRLPNAPKFESFATVQKKAKMEYLWYLRCKMISDRSTLRGIIDDFNNGLFYSENCDTPKDSCFLDYTTSSNGTWCFSKRPQRLGHAYGVGFNIVAGKITTCELFKLFWDQEVLSDKPRNCGMYNYVLINDLTYLMNEMVIYRNLQNTFMRKERRVSAKVVLKDGVPGCGKSTWILNNANLKRDVVLSMGKEATVDLREKFEEKYAFGKKELNRVRTVDSYLMHDCGKEMTCNTLHFDEALMAHAGMVYFCADLLGARKLICQGDSQQIPFVNRVESITLRYANLVIDKTDKIRHTYRSPIDVACYLTMKGYYGADRITTTNSDGRSLGVVGPRHEKPMTSVYCVPYLAGVQYLTFTQAEKEDLHKALRSKGPVSVSTVHEAQGKTFNDVILVRLKTTENEIYPGGRKSKPYSIVGVTRHRRSLVYYTAIEDRLYYDIEDMKRVMEDKLMKSFNGEHTK
ncbi:helicase [Sorghum chlorotic spot virus]|uniref:145-kDa protein n=3 Tax=Sorghum chlorotic spot virus TaxID=107804 RepID=Q9JGJ7_9VIRU|nr:helicase [Sorghum chlorotic spot virus]BAA94802.1 145-kDa protein [Sorghum chlorotic spot virus]